MKKLPSFKTTCQRVFKLYFDTFLYVLPFVLACVACEFFFTKFLVSEQSSQFTRIFAVILLLIIAGLFYVFVIKAVYNKYHQQATDYTNCLKEGIKRYPDFLLSQVILMIPLMVLITLIFIPQILGHEPSAVASFSDLVLKSIMVLSACAAVAYLLFCLYFYVSPVHIINEKYDAVSGLKKSLNLIKGYWLDTFLLIFSLALLVIVLEWLLRFALGDYASELARLLTFSLGACLVVVHCDHLEKVHDTTLASTVSHDAQVPKIEKE